MEEMNLLSNWLNENKGRWTKIAGETGLSTKTLSRIANGEVDSVHLTTYKKLTGAMQAPAPTPEHATA